MTDNNKVYNAQDQGHYQQFNDYQQQYSQQTGQYYQQQPTYEQQYQYQQPANLGYQQPVNQYYQGGAYQQPSAQNEYYNSYPSPVDQPYNINASPVDSALSTKEQYTAFYKFLWVVFIWESFGFGWWVVSLIKDFRFFYFGVLPLLSLGQCVVLFMTSVTTQKLIKAFQTNDANAFFEGKKVFTVLDAYQFIIHLLYLLADSSGFQIRLLFHIHFQLFRAYPHGDLPFHYP